MAATKEPTHKPPEGGGGGGGDIVWGGEFYLPYVAIPRLLLQKGFPRHELYKPE